MDLIRIIFEKVSTSNEWANSSDVDNAITEAKKYDKDLKELLGDSYNLEVEELIVAQICEHQECGFRMGFKTAMRLVSECCNFSLPKGGVENE